MSNFNESGLTPEEIAERYAAEEAALVNPDLPPLDVEEGSIYDLADTVDPTDDDFPAPISEE